MTNLPVEKRLKANIDIPMPENTVTKQNARLWREHYIYCSAQADAYHTILDGTTTIHLDTQPNNPVESKIEPMFFKAEIKAAIEAERNKLKEAEL